jgi:hypothetical protein
MIVLNTSERALAAKAVLKTLQERVCKMGFSGKAGVVLEGHAFDERMPERTITNEELMICLLTGSIIGFQRPEKKQTKRTWFKVCVVGKSGNGDDLEVVLAVKKRGRNKVKKSENWFFKIVTVFQYNNDHKKEAVYTASLLFKSKKFWVSYSI